MTEQVPLPTAGRGDGVALPRARRRSSWPLRRGVARQQAVAGFVLVLPALLMIATFFLAPMGMMIWMSFNRWPLFGSTRFVGLDNYRAALDDDVFKQSLIFTAKYSVLVTALVFVVGLGLAFLVKESRRGVGIFRSAYFLPMVIGFATASYLWVWFLNPQVGILDRLLQDLHVTTTPVSWLGDSALATAAVVVMTTWKTAGFSMLVLMGGIQGVPRELHEAARVDGAGRWALFRLVVLPLIRRSIALVLVLTLISSVLTFDQFYILTHGGPGTDTLTAVQRIFNVSFFNFQLGYGATLSIILMAILIVLSSVQLFLLRDTT